MLAVAGAIIAGTMAVAGYAIYKNVTAPKPKQ